MDEERGGPIGEEPLRPSPPPGLLMPSEEKPRSEAAARSTGKRYLLAVLTLVVLAAAALGVLGYRSFAAPAAGGGAGPPPMVPSTPFSERPWRVLTPLPEADLAGPVGSSVVLGVRALRARNVPLADTLVHFSVVEGAGELEVERARTNPDGVARTSVLLPPRPEVLRVAAAVVGADFPAVEFSIEATAGPPARIVALEGTGQEADPGALLPEELGVLVVDRDDNPVPGEEVRFRILAGGGLLAPSRIPTDSLGRARVRWRLGVQPGEQLLAAEIPRVEGLRLTFSATARGEPATSRPSSGAGPPAGDPGSVDRPANPPGSSSAGSSAGSGSLTVSGPRFAVGGGHVCLVAAGRTLCRGDDERGQAGGGVAEAFSSLAAGLSHTCALRASGAAACWGANQGGQLGDGSRTDRSDPVAVAGDLRFTVLAAGASHTCGLTAAGQAACWGVNGNGQLGDGSREDRAAPAPIQGGRSFRNLVAGWNHTCGVSVGDEVFCWGRNSDGQLGDGSREDRTTPTETEGGRTYQTLEAGSAHTCGISGDRAFCWGDNRFGQLGDGSDSDRTAPVLVRGLPGTPVGIAAGAVHTCALTDEGIAYCWGQNLHGQLGDGSTESRGTPAAVAGGLRFRALHAGGALTCGFTTGGGQYCWGLNRSGQLGDGTRDNRLVPTRVGA